VAVAGVGGDRPRLEALTRELGLSDIVRFVGFVPNEALPMYYNACDLFVCPTVRVESFGIVLAEAMACSKPVVSSSTGGTRYVIEDGKSGILVPPRNVQALSDAVMLLHDQRDRGRNLGAEGRARAVKFLSTDRMVEDTEFVIRKVLDQSRCE
jgi:rhamnosyl/mannosyltransferase